MGKINYTRFLVVLLLFTFQHQVGFALFDTIDVEITVTSDSLATFKGIGFNVTGDLASNSRFNTIYDNPASRKAFIEEFIGESKFNNIVLWGGPRKEWFYDTLTKEVSDVYVTWLKEFIAYGGLMHVMLNPTDKIFVKNNPDGPRVSMVEQLRFQTDIVKKFELAGVPVYATTYRNKPNTNDSGTYRQDEDSIVKGLPILRHMLDTMGLAHVKITGPTTIEWFPKLETSGGDNYDFQSGDTELYLNAIVNDNDAVNSLDAFDKQTYGDGISEWWREKATQNNKEIWQMLSITESSQTDSDPSVPPIVSATCMADMNHGATIWNTWVTFRLLKGGGGYTPLYHHLKNISTNFEYGCILKRCESTPALPTADMHWNYFNMPEPADYLQPKIVASAALNPDSSWVIGLVNITGIKAQHQPSSLLLTDVQLQNRMNITVDVPELRDKQKVYFSVYKSFSDRIEKLDQVVMEYGRLNLFLFPSEHFVLHSDSVGTPTSIESFSAIDLDIKAYPNPFTEEVSVRFKAPANADATIEIFDLNGRTLFYHQEYGLQPGYQEFRWNGTNGSGDLLPAGVYIVRVTMQAGNNMIVKNAKLIKR